MTRRTVTARMAVNPPLSTEQMPQLLNEKQAAAWLGVSLAYLRRGRSKGTTGRRTPTPRFVRVEGRVYYRLPDLETWVAGLTAREAI